MTGFARPCVVCGRRTPGGKARCADHENQRYAIRTACYACGRHSAKGYCPEHDPWAGDKVELDRLKRQPWRAGYRTPSYRAGKKAALARARGACERCGRTDLALEVDHRIPLSTATSPDDFPALNDPSNLWVLCQACHRAKTSKGGRR